MKLGNLLETLHVYTATKSIENVQVNGIKMDSRAVQKNDLFICIEGFTVDGHDFVAQAEEKGASAIIAQKPIEASIPVILVNDSTKALAKLSNHFYGYPTNHLHLVGVTGTNGKTTTSYLIDSIFQEAQQTTGLIGTIQMKIGENTYPVKNTTPDSLFLQQNFSQMVDEGVDTAVMEVSSHALDLGRVHGCDFDIAVYTNLSQDHLDFHKDMDDYLRAKSLLFSQLGNGYHQKPKYAVINRDDEHSDFLIKSTAQEVITYGLDDRADIVAKNLSLTASGTSFTLGTPKGDIYIESPLVGKFSVYNMLAAASTAWLSGISLETIKKSLEHTKGVRGRFEPVLAGQDFGVIVDYAHTPDSLENVLKTVKSFVENRIFVVVGCGGDRDRTKRPLMAQVAVKYSDHTYLTSDNPRSEDPKAILEDMEKGITGEGYTVIVDRREAINEAVQHATAGDVIVIAGKGHETYQEINGERTHFDDVEVAKESIQSRY
ncbi:UDP-N-acetylmuramoyl-L-alanyl-D-glutamate--2,6-diaminopimelate ligase [Pontibacillus marinus]|uniref:UDP-N-acetylmuramoyl-L-alanyl-D-glutamate--2,6-diaminopimelate ligase n=1 Tax=Pontibacillus marinus BH030004 = DSM 16465 TaxID=1385511 RepID=A0A0A5HJD3_9BACI|nr:UDP-N-acetylmuramoyl-L-alanyl-D-glutamate--2,6-diaminopimelate ligase [Pontibacillus marinus]KGX83757.1 UDP-N-acetylmuramoylalanyl-D-glutamate--2,6-diaminopimelate ligase [Pontibacillus marinus BH030004 = DSM 16465]